MFSSAVEDYLKVMYTLQAKEGKLTTSSLARQLGVAPSSVTGMLKKLSGLGLVSHQRYQGASLTTRGRQGALQVIRRHRLAEVWLREVLGLPLDRVHAEAHHWEHVLSDEVVERLDSLLDHPRRDPHGAPIPTAEGHLPISHHTPLAQLAVGEPAEICEVSDHDPELLRYLDEHGLLPQAHVRILAREPFDGPVALEVDGKRHVVGTEVTHHVFVLHRPVSKTSANPEDS